MPKTLQAKASIVLQYPSQSREDLNKKVFIIIILPFNSSLQPYPGCPFAVCPLKSVHKFRVLTIGRSLSFPTGQVQTQLVKIYPNCGCFVEKLNLMTDVTSVDIITQFLTQFPSQHKLKHLRLALSPTIQSFWSSGQLPYLELLIDLVATSSDLTRLSFNNVQPLFLLIDVASHCLTRLDIGHIYSSDEETFIPLMPHLDVLSFTCTAVSYFSGPPPATLCVVILKNNDITSFLIMEELQDFIARCPAIDSIAMVGVCPYPHP